MQFDLVMITTGSRPKLLEQSLCSLKENATGWSKHKLTLVMDGCSVVDVCRQVGVVPDRIIINPERQGASRSRNIGASSTPRYRRGDFVCFFDEDIYAVKGWDSQIEHIWNYFEPAKPCIYSLHAHPFNHTVILASKDFYVTNVISTVHMAMSWYIWDNVGFYQEPGGAGGSEDVDYCARAVANMSASLVVGIPQGVLHTGIGSTSGKKLIGWEHVMENNRKLERIHGIEGKVIYG